MITIGILGASGQVGTETCLFLKTYTDVRPVAIVRAQISGALLRRLGVEVRTGTLRDPRQARELLQDCDVIVDFSMSSGSVEEIRRHYLGNITRALGCSRPDAKFVFVSTINAFGLGPRFNKAKRYFLPHTVYGYTKRYAERLVMRTGRRVKKQTYVFRLGHVHGLLQRVSHETRQLMRSGYRRFEYPDTPSHTVFCHTIAEALVNVGKGVEKPNTYTVISDPPWSWKEIVEYHAEPGTGVEVELRPLQRSNLFRKAASALRSSALTLLNDHRETLRANILHHFPQFERRAAAFAYVQRARRQIQRFDNRPVYRAGDVHAGIFPGPRLAHVTDSRSTMTLRTEQVRRILEAISCPSERV